MKDDIFSTRLINEKYDIEIGLDSSFVLGSQDNRYFDRLINPAEVGEGERYQALRISVEGQKSTELIIIASGELARGDFAILEGDVITLLHGRHITQLDLESGLALSVELDTAEAFSLYRVQGGFLIHGELEIIKFDDNLNKLWEWVGNDILVSISGKKSLELTKSSIRLTDFSDNFYELDYDGNPIR